MEPFHKAKSCSGWSAEWRAGQAVRLCQVSPSQHGQGLLTTPFLHSRTLFQQRSRSLSCVHFGVKFSIAPAHEN